MDSDPNDGDPLPEPCAMTSLHVRRAAGGDSDSLAWVVGRLSPLLIAQADYRLGPDLRRLYDPEDLVNDAWLIALPRLTELAEHSERHTPVLLKFLTTTLTYRINNLLKKHIRGRPRAEPTRGSPSETRADGLDNLPANTRGAITRAVGRELQGQVAECLAGLEPTDREILLLRGIEQRDNREVAELLGLSPKATVMRYQRALAKMRARLPQTVFDELPE